MTGTQDRTAGKTPVTGNLRQRAPCRGVRQLYGASDQWLAAGEDVVEVASRHDQLGVRDGAYTVGPG